MPYRRTQPVSHSTAAAGFSSGSSEHFAAGDRPAGELAADGSTVTMPEGGPPARGEGPGDGGGGAGFWAVVMNALRITAVVGAVGIALPWLWTTLKKWRRDPQVG